MRKACMCTVLLAAVFQCALSSGETCGVVVNSMCCGSSQPADTTCVCRAQGPNCTCSTATGGAQTGTIIVCYTGNWTYTTPATYKIIGIPSARCFTLQNCLSGDEQNGYNVGCGNEGNCDTGIPCAWVVVSDVNAPQVTTNGLCPAQPPSGDD